MKYVVLFFITIFMCFHVCAQESQKIVLTPFIPNNSGIPVASQKSLENKLKTMILASGFGAETNQRFIVTAKVNILTEDVTDTAPALFAYTLNVELYMGDGISGTLFSSVQLQTKGIGNSKDKAYMLALKNLNPHDVEFKRFISEGKEKIVLYFDLNAPTIIESAKTLAKKQQFDEAIYELSTIPDVCSKYFDQANDLMVDIFKMKIDKEGYIYLAEAKALWNANQNRETANKVGTILASINPMSSAFEEAKILHEQIATRIKDLDEREWAFKLQQYEDKISIRKSLIQLARDVAVTWLSNRPTTIYKSLW